MKKFFQEKLKKKSVWIPLVAALAVVLMAASVVVYAYYSNRAMLYSNDGQREVFRIGMSLNSFFDRISGVSNGTSLNIECRDESITTGVTAADADGKRYYTYNANAEWGTANNPFIISDLKHLQNLSVLQNIGYFSAFTDEFGRTGSTMKAEQCMPYFLVCTPTGNAVKIDGTQMEAPYEPIGNDANPFIGYVGGAFTANPSVTVDGKSCDQSVLYKIKIQPTADYVDVGLFGNIGYLGDESTATEANPRFQGAAASVCDLLLYDTQIIVKHTTAWQAIVDWTAHKFGFKTNANTDGIPHENHHIGILAGHVEYATVKQISVYYSSPSIAAIDVSHVNQSSNGVKANYSSASGILGFVHSMNSTQSDGFIMMDGTSDADISVSNGGVGTGGGLLSGTGRGYVTAAEVFQAYHAAGEIVHYTVNGQAHDSLLVIQTANGYQLGDGSAVTLGTTNVGGVQVPCVQITTTYTQYFRTRTETATWTEFVVRSGSEGNYTYKHLNQTNVTGVETTGIYLRFAAGYNNETGEFEKLCTQYYRQGVIGGAQATQRYYFYDGVFTFSLSGADDTITPTWDNETGDTYTLGSTNANDWKKNLSSGNSAVVAYIKPITSTQELSDAMAVGKKVVILKQKTDGTYALVTLSETPAIGSWQDGDDICSINSKDVMGVDQDTLESLYNAFSNNVISTSDVTRPAEVNGQATRVAMDVTNAELVQNWNDYTVLYFGDNESSAGASSVAEVESKYLVTAEDRNGQDTSYAMADGRYTT